MIEHLDDMPDGVLGFKVSGEVSRTDYDEVLMPPIRKLIEDGGKVKAVCQIGPDFHGYDKDAEWDDVKQGAEWGIGPHDDWHRIAVVTDEKKLRKVTKIFGWLAPGEAKLFRVSELEKAADWASDGMDEG